jgi:hypothetical protein
MGDAAIPASNSADRSVWLCNIERMIANEQRRVVAHGSAGTTEMLGVQRPIATHAVRERDRVGATQGARSRRHPTAARWTDDAGVSVRTPSLCPALNSTPIPQDVDINHPVRA